MTRHLRLLVLASLLQSGFAARASVLTVTRLDDDGQGGSLRYWMNVAQDGDTITFNVTGTIRLRDELYVYKRLTITGPGADKLEITRGTSGNFRLLEVDDRSHGGTLAVHVSGVTFSNGHVGQGDAILSTGTLSVTNCNFINNGYIGSAGSPTYGGAIWSSSSLEVRNCRFTGNAATFGGAIYDNLILFVGDSSFANNQATNGGAIYNTGNAFQNAQLVNCTMNANAASDEGGAIATAAGGSNATMSLANCTLAGNSAALGGAIANIGDTNRASLDLTNCTIASNSATSGGGGIYNVGQNAGNAFVTIGNTILQVGPAGANLVNIGDGTSITSKGYNLSSDNGGGFLSGTADQISTDPKLDALNDNGGAVETIGLLPGSPAWDRGKSFNYGYDARGFLRPYDVSTLPNASGGDGSDIGAMEMDNAPVFVVTNLQDHDDGTCSPSDCTLREALNAAQAAGDGFSVSFQNGLSGTLFLSPGLGSLLITKSVTISGPGPRQLAISGNNATRVFNVTGGPCIMSYLTIRDGFDSGGNSGGVLVAHGGAVTFIDVAFIGNGSRGADSTTAGGDGNPANGGAILNQASVTVFGCTFSGNGATGGKGAKGLSGINSKPSGGAGGGAFGGAINNAAGATLLLSNSTFNGNTASGGAGGDGDGAFGGKGGDAAAGTYNAGAMTITAATISGNIGTGGAGGVGNNKLNNGAAGAGSGGLTDRSNNGGTVRNTISAGNTGTGSGGPDADGAFTSQGYNLIGTAAHSTGFNATGDQISTNANLGPLQDNGGPTDTMALLSGSAAIDAGNAFGLGVDQRNYSRPSGNGADIGAYESSSVVAPTPTPTPSATPVQTPTPTPTPTASPAAQPLNISTRMEVLTDDKVLIAGLIVTGPPGTSKKVMLRGLGPSLANQGVPNPIPDPLLELNQPDGSVVTNDNWQDASNSAEIPNGFQPSDSREAVIIATLPIGSEGFSNFTAILRGAHGETGVGLAEAYDLDQAAPSQFANISTRGFVDGGDNVMIGGFILGGGTQSPHILLRGIGPSLGNDGVGNPLADPTLELHDGNGATVATNDNWKVDDHSGASQETAITSTGAAPPNDLESALLLDLVPGNYTAIVAGKDATSGVALVEVYAIR